MDWKIQTHNGAVTMVNPETGQHRTVRIRTQSADSTFRPNTRIASLRTGASDSWHDWTQFGFVTDGQIKVWRKHLGTKFETYAKMINNPQAFEARGIEYMAEGRCRKCNRQLTNPESIGLGIGPICREAGF